MSDLRNAALDAYSNDPASAQHLNELIAELRDRGVTPRPLNVLAYALELGMSEQAAADIAALLERRLQMGGQL
ncbi:hypothetical protein [Microvirga lenta]|uniref:hypothetical protein n=1 Tax=Microvirga lenta TaxID=2881337 RepID=UPI001CFFBEAB|nr:hypothetical protein [Microvirga lenta]MCB5176773.1 hypothetical protein [Microvirga lenta]